MRYPLIAKDDAADALNIFYYCNSCQKQESDEEEGKKEKVDK
jgi:hypothetical protein